MKFFARIAVLFYVTVILLFGVTTLLFISHFLITLDDVVLFATAVYHDDELRILFANIAGVVLLINLVFYRRYSISTRREKMIAFDNPSGRVSVSLAALEGLVKRIMTGVPEIKDVKTVIQIVKKGLKINVNLILRSEVNIPTLTAQIQEAIKRKVQDTIGVDGKIDVVVYVGKIYSEKVVDYQQTEESVESKDKLNIPFDGYRA